MAGKWRVSLRVRITLIPEQGEIKLPYSYNYSLTSAIYSLLRESSPRFSEFLHQEGYSYGEGKVFKLFTFSPLLTSQRKALEKEIILGGKIEWLLSSPREDFLLNLVNGVIDVGYLSLMQQKLTVEKIEVLETPAFSQSMSFRTLSPIVVSTGEKSGDGTFHKRFVSPSESRFYEILEGNLHRKYRVYYGKDAPQERLIFEPDQGFIAHRERISKLIDYKGIKIRGWMFPFRTEGNSKLIQIGYEAGFGEGNSAGFGMVEVTRE